MVIFTWSDLDTGKQQCPNYADESWTPLANYDQEKQEFVQRCYCLSSIPANIPNETQYIEIGGNPIFNIKPEDFRNLTRCRYINLRNNRIKSIQSRAFLGLRVVEEILLSDNKIEIIDGTSFSGLQYLKRLTLSNNLLTVISYGTFGNLPSLNYLELHGNKLGTFHVNSFLPPAAPKVLYLSLASNPVRCDKALCWLIHGQSDGWIKWIKYGNKELVPTCTNTGDSWFNIDICLLGGCPYNSPNMGSDYSKICSALTEIPLDIPRDAQVVALQGNSIPTIPANAFAGLTRVKEIRLSNNKIENVLNNAFQDLSTLEELRLDQNRISNLEAHAFNGLTSLNKLFLQRNALKVVEAGTFGQLPQVNYLNMANNQLVNLTYNVFTSDVQTTDQIKKRSTKAPLELALDLAGNPLICSVSLCWTKDNEKMNINWLTKPECNGSHAAWNSMDCVGKQDHSYLIFLSIFPPIVDQKAPPGTKLKKTGTSLDFSIASRLRHIWNCYNTQNLPYLVSSYF